MAAKSRLSTPHRVLVRNRAKPLTEHQRLVVHRLLLQGLSIPAIANWMKITEGWVESVRKREAAWLRRSTIWPGPPGGGDFARCRFCGAQTRMPCMRCAIRALESSPTGESWEP